MIKEKVIKYTSLVCAVVCFFLIVFLSLKSGTGKGSFFINDKVAHCFAYFCFSFFVTLYAQFVTEHKKGLFIVCLVLSLSLGLGIEYLQPYFNRSKEMLDFIADFLGSIVGCVAALRVFPICKL